jgi:hypothetical protein
MPQHSMMNAYTDVKHRTSSAEFTDDVLCYLEHVRTTAHTMPHLQESTRAKMHKIVAVLPNRPTSSDNHKFMLRVAETIRGALSCPDTIHATISSGNILPQIAGDLPVQIDLIRNGCSAYEQSLAASRTSTLLIHGLRTPSIQIFNVLFAIDGRMMYSWLIRVDEGPYFTELVDSVYQAVKIWGWSISVSAALWSAFRHWQWSTLWKPLTEVALLK